MFTIPVVAISETCTRRSFGDQGEQDMSQLVIPDEILWNPILSAGISRYLSRKDRLNCQSLIPTWDLLTTRVLGLTPAVCSRQVQLLDILQDEPHGVEIITLNFAARRGKNVIQILSALSGPGGTRLINLTTLDIMKQPINLGQLGELLAKCPMPRLRYLSLSVIVSNARPRITECLKCELKVQDVAIRFFGGLSSCELLLLVQSFGDLRSLSLDDSHIDRYRIGSWRGVWASYQTRIPQWTSLQIHYKSELLDLFLGESWSDYELSKLTLLTEPGHFFPKRYITEFSVIHRIVKYHTLNKPQFHTLQFCRACVSDKDRCNMPSLQCPSTDTVEDDESPVNFVACSLMTVEDNCLLHPTNLRDLYIHISPTGTSSSTSVTNSSPSPASSVSRRQTPVKGSVEALIQRRCSEIRRLCIRLCKFGNDARKGNYIQEMPSLARDCFLPIIEKCCAYLQSLEVSAELITACCSDVLTTRRLLRLQDKCLNVRKATVIAGGDLVERQLRPSAKNISTYLSLFPALKEVRIVAIDIFTEQIIPEILTTCGHLRRLYIYSLRNLTFDFASLPSHNALETIINEILHELAKPLEQSLICAADGQNLVQTRLLLFPRRAPDNLLETKERDMSQLVIPDEILWNPILSAGISRYLSRKDRLNCKSLIPTWDLLTTRILGLTSDVCSKQVQLLDTLQDAPQGVEIFTLNFAARRGKNVIQILSTLFGPDGTGLSNLTTLDIMKQPINLGQLGILLAKCPMPRLRNISLSVIVSDARPSITKCLESELKLQEVAIRFFGSLSSCELLLLIQSFGDLRSLSLDDSQIDRYWNIGWRRDWESYQSRIPQWTSLQIHHKSELLDFFLSESRLDYELSELTLLTEPGHFFPKRYITEFSVIPRIVKYRTLKKPQFHTLQFCRACVSAKDRCNMPILQCPSADTVHDGEASVIFVACSLMTVEDNCLLHPTSLHDLYIHIRPPGTSSSTTVTNSSPSLESSVSRWQAPVRGSVEALIERRCSEIRRLCIRLCKPGNDARKGKYIQEIPSLARDCFLPIIEKCGPNLQSLEVSAELITACCSDVLTTRRLLRLQNKCLNVGKATVIAGGDPVERKLRPSAKNISTYLGLFPALKEVRIIAIDIFSERIIQEILTTCGRLRRLYIFSLRNPTFDFASLPSHNELELLFMDLNRFYVKDRFEILLKETLSKLHSLRYILLRVDGGRYPFEKTLKAFFADRSELRWLVVVFNRHRKTIDGGGKRVLWIRSSCGQSNYVGETGRLLRTRIAEHVAAVRRNDANSQVAAHSTRPGYTFKFDEAEILARGDNRVSRELLEPWFTGPQSINKSNDIPTPYSVLRHRLAKAIDHSRSAQAGEPDGRAIITPASNTGDEMSAINNLHAGHQAINAPGGNTP
nr:unnamed protein product [Spirometra erinaceieuropaei]